VYHETKNGNFTSSALFFDYYNTYDIISGARCKYKTGLVNTYSVYAGPVQFNATSRFHKHKIIADYQLNMLLSVLFLFSAPLYLRTLWRYTNADIIIIIIINE